jgi:hypothetical protein
MALLKNNILKILLAFFAVLLVLLALLPTILSTTWGTNQLLKIINKQIPGKVNISDASFSWSGPQSIQNLSLNDPTGKPVITINSFKTDSSLWNLYNNGPISKLTKIQGLDVTIEEEQAGHTNLHSALGNTYLPYRLENASHTPLFVSLVDVNADISLPKNAHWPVAHAKGQTKFGKLSGEFTVDSAQDGTLKVLLTHFPVALIDHLISLKKPNLTGLSRAALGEIVDLTVTHSLVQNGLQFELHANSTNLVADFAGHIVNSILTLNPVGTATFSITPELIKQIEQISGSPLKIELQKPSQATLMLDKLSIPLSFLTNEENRTDVAISTTLTIPQTDLIGDGSIGTISARQVQASIHMTPESPTTLFQISGDILQNGQPLQLRVNGSFDKPKKLEQLTEALLNQLNIKIDLQGVPSALSNQFKEIQILGEINGSITRNANFQMTTHLIPIAQSKPGIAFGKTIQIRIDANLRDMKNWEPIKIDVSSDLLQGQLLAEIHNGNHLHLKNPSEIKYQLTPAFLAHATGLDPKVLTLQSPSVLNLKLDPTKSPILLSEIASGKYSSVHLTGNIEANSIKFLSSENDDIPIEKLVLPWDINGYTKHIQADLNGYIRLIKDAQGTISGNVVISDWLNEEGIDFKKAALKAHVTLGKLPVIFFVALLPEQDVLLKFLGTALNVNMDVNIHSLATREGTVEVAFQGDQLQGNVGINIGEKISLINTSQPIKITTLLTPERFEAARQLLSKKINGDDSDTGVSQLVLLEPTLVTASVTKMNISTEGDNGYVPHELVADLIIDPMTINRAGEDIPIYLNKTSAHFDSKNMAKKMSFQIKGEEQNKQTEQINPFNFSGNIENLFNDAGAIDINGLSLNFEAKSKSLPAGLFCQLVCLREDARNRLEALFGETLETDIRAHLKRMNGPVEVLIKGQNGRLKLDAQLNNGIVILNTPFEVEIQVTPKLGASLLEELLPILSGVVSAENPVKISIDPKGFSMPISPFKIEKIKMDNATINLGKMLFNKSGDLGDIFDLLRPSSKDELSVWFTPAYISIQDGVMRLKRMDMLIIGRYPIALWGKVDTVKDRVDMRIGISGAALTQAINLGDIDPETLMQIPLTGTMKSNGIDKAKAATRMSALVAQSKGGAHGLLIGAFLDIAGGSLSEEKAPDPTTNPLPWANLMKASNQPKPQEKDKKKDKKEKTGNTGKQLEKAATSLIDSLFN